MPQFIHFSDEARADLRGIDRGTALLILKAIDHSGGLVPETYAGFTALPRLAFASGSATGASSFDFWKGRLYKCCSFAIGQRSTVDRVYN